MSKLYYFNPDSEMAIANGSRYYTPPANIVRMADELAFLPAYFSNKGDALLMKRLPSPEFTEMMKRQFGLEPEIILLEEYEHLSGRIPEPWGWSPRVAYIMKAEDKYTGQKELYSRKTAFHCLERLCETLPFVEPAVLPVICYSTIEIGRHLQTGKSYLVKAPWSSSGKGLLKINREGITPKAQEWLKGIFRRQGYVMLEEFQHKVCDFAMEFYSDGIRVELVGLSLFYTGEHGEYRGNYVGPQSEIERKLITFIGKEKFDCLKREVSAVLSDSIISRYTGYLGVDMMVYRNAKGEYSVQPCLEINLRYTMGLLAMSLFEQYTFEACEGIFTVSFQAVEGEAWQMHCQQAGQNPAGIISGKLRKGYINLTPVYPDSKFVACLCITGEIG